MGCIQALPESTEASGAKNITAKEKTKKLERMPLYVTADPDLGWRNITDGLYPVFGFNLCFQNDRSGSVLNNVDLTSLALNIAKRAANLADQFGVTDARDLQSQMNLFDSLGQSDVPVVRDTVDRDMQRVLKTFGCPRFNWRLVSRLEETSSLIRTAPEVFLQTPGVEGHQALTELAAVPDYLQLLQNTEGRFCIADVAEVAMNIAEQLTRLERGERCSVASPPVNDPDTLVTPTHLFGWRILDNMSGVHHAAGSNRNDLAVPVATPEGDALMLVPEELIMDVASWVQATYLTASAF